MVSAIRLEQKALSLAKAFERSGRTVKRVIVDGRRIELEFSTEVAVDAFDTIDMRHGET